MTRTISSARGVATMTVGYLLLGVQPVFLKLALERGFTTPESVALRFAISLGLAIPVALWTRQSLRTKQPAVWLLRGVLGGLAVLLYFESVRLAGAALGTLLNYTYPIWANLLSFIIGERPSRMIWLALPLAIAGTVLVVAPDGPTGVGRGELAGLTSAALAGGAIVCIKRLRRTDGELTIITSFSSLGLLMALPALPWFTAAGAESRPLDGLTWFFAILVGLLSFYGHMYFTRGYKETTIQLGTVLSLIVPALAAAFGWLVLDERLAPSALAGATLIALAVVLIALREHKLHRSSRSPSSP